MINVEPTIANTTLTADTEASYALPNFTVSFTIKARSTTSTLRIAVVSGETATNYITIPPGSGGWSQEVKGRSAALTIYIRSNEADTAEIISWHN